MAQDFKQLIKQYSQDLPDYAQEALSSFDWLSVISEIAAKYHLSGKQYDALVTETSLVLLQVAPADMYRTNLLNHVGVSEAIAHQIVVDVRDRIIDRLQKELQRIVGEAPEILERALLQFDPDTRDAMRTTLQNPLPVPLAPQTQARPMNVNDPYHEPIE